jgi:2-C-methyl-D-erythritol 4-phosphate cytidylyltransferase
MPRFLALIPAAGSGSRMAGSLPKQYLEIAGRPLLAHAIACLARHPLVEEVFVVLAPQDAYFARCDWRAFAGKLTPLYCGGSTRAQSVFNGLLAAGDAMEAADWVLVHDAARPCLGRPELDRLLDLREDPTGGLLAVPVADTLKRAGDRAEVARTEPRDGMWLAQTPQMFRYRLLLEGLRLARDMDATDEARAIEGLGLKPRLVMGSARNIKVTYPEDLELAEMILQSGAQQR